MNEVRINVREKDLDKLNRLLKDIKNPKILYSPAKTIAEYNEEALVSVEQNIVKAIELAKSMREY